MKHDIIIVGTEKDRLTNTCVVSVSGTVNGKDFVSSAGFYKGRYRWKTHGNGLSRAELSACTKKAKEIASSKTP